MKLFLHIGVGKAGTSAIQSALAKNIHALLARNIVYPEMPSLRRARANLTTIGNGAVLARMLSAAADDSAVGWRVYREMRAAATAGQDILYSSEIIAQFDPDRARQFREFATSLGFEPRIIIYVRSIVDHALSSYNQQIKTAKWRGNLLDFLVSGYQEDQRAILEKALGVFDARELIVRNYDAAKSELIADFFSGALGIEESSGFTMENVIVNRSLTDVELAIMCVMGPIIDDRHSSRSMADIITSGDPIGRRVACVSSDAMRVIEDRFGRDPAFISAHIQGPPIALKSDAIVIADDALPHLTEAEVVLARVVAQLFKGMRDQ